MPEAPRARSRPPLIARARLARRHRLRPATHLPRDAPRIAAATRLPAGLREVLEGGKIRPVPDRTYPLSDAAEAIAYREHGHARGKVVITVSRLPFVAALRRVATALASLAILG